MDVARLMQKGNVKLATDEDWMIASIVALTAKKPEKSLI